MQLTIFLFCAVRSLQDVTYASATVLPTTTMTNNVFAVGSFYVVDNNFNLELVFCFFNIGCSGHASLQAIENVYVKMLTMNFLLCLVFCLLYNGVLANTFVDMLDYS